MIRRALVLRPEPGNARTAARLAAAGFAVERCPLFAVAPVAWTPPGAAGFDALLLTSANAVRHAGPGLATFGALPVLAVGTATAAAAREAGLDVVLTGDRDAAALVAQAQASGHRRLLHLAGRDRLALPGVDQLTVYAADPVPVPSAVVRRWPGAVALLHSPRAARRFAELVARDSVERGSIAVAALSPAVADAAGPGWAALATAPVPTDAALIDRAGAAADKEG